MSTHKNIDKICVVIVVLSLILTILFVNGESLGITKVVDEDAEQNSDSVYFTVNDQNGSWDTSSATVITLGGSDATVSGNGAYVNDGNVVITNGGYYVVSGTLSDGSITVDAYDSSKVWILLNGVSINCSDDACIRVDQADKVFLTLADGSENTLTSGSVYSDTALADGTDGAIFAHDDLTINGSGSLTVDARYMHGITANDDLVITGGTISVTAAADAIHANDSIRIKDASITATGGDDGIVTSNETENGYMYVESGTLRVTASDDGIHTTGEITVAGGDITISAGDDGIHSDSSVSVSDGAIMIEECYEGIEALTIDVSGGDITIYPEDDGFNANGGSGDAFGFGGHGGGQMSGHGGGQMSGDQTSGDGGSQMGSNQTSGDQTSGDGGSQMGSDQTSGDGGSQMGGQMGGHGGKMGGHGGRPGRGSNGEMQAPPDMSSDEASGEMPTPPDMPADGASGEMPTPPDMPTDGASGEMPTPPDMSDGGSQTAQKQDETQNAVQESGASTDEETYISISGGTITIINENGRDADGLDTNGDLRISGGTIYVSLIGTGSNSAVDYGSESGGVAEITGGTIIACGASSMAEAFDSSSTQASVLYNTSTASEAGTTLALKDMDGNVLVSWDVPLSFTSALISCPQMQVGESYQVVIGDNAEEITIEEVSASYGDAQSSMFGGNMNWGGMHSRGETGGRGDFSSNSSEGASAVGEMAGDQAPDGDGDQAPDGTDGQMPDGDSDQVPDGAGGQAPDGTDGQVPNGDSDQVPDGAGGQAPDEADGQASDRTDGQTPDGSVQSGTELSQEEEDLAAAAQVSTVETVDKQTWTILGGCVAALAAGIVVAIFYRKH